MAQNSLREIIKNALEGRFFIARKLLSESNEEQSFKIKDIYEVLDIINVVDDNNPLRYFNLLIKYVVSSEEVLRSSYEAIKYDRVANQEEVQEAFRLRESQIATKL